MREHHSPLWGSLFPRDIAAFFGTVWVRLQLHAINRSARQPGVCAMARECGFFFLSPSPSFSSFCFLFSFLELQWHSIYIAAPCELQWACITFLQSPYPLLLFFLFPCVKRVVTPFFLLPPPTPCPILSSAVTPFDVIKTRLQAQEMNMSYVQKPPKVECNTCYL